MVVVVVVECVCVGVWEERRHKRNTLQGCEITGHNKHNHPQREIEDRSTHTTAITVPHVCVCVNPHTGAGGDFTLHTHTNLSHGPAVRVQRLEAPIGIAWTEYL